MTSPQRNDCSLFIPNVVLRFYYWFSFWNIHWNQSLSDVLTHCLFTCRFIRNLLYFYKPSSQRFCTVHISDPQARTFSEVGCLLIDFLLDGEDVRYNFCSKGSGVKGLVWGSVNNQTRWHVQVKLFYFLFCFIFVFIFCFVLFLFLFLFFFSDKISQDVYDKKDTTLIPTPAIVIYLPQVIQNDRKSWLGLLIKYFNIKKMHKCYLQECLSYKFKFRSSLHYRQTLVYTFTLECWRST